MRKLIHGEVIFYESNKLPKGLKKIIPDDDYMIVGESETHGNDHRVAVKDKLKVRFYEDEQGLLYMENLEATTIYCPKPNRHDTVILPEGIWEIEKAKEYDYANMQVRKVVD